MRKVIWCGCAAGLLSAGSFLSLAYYACRCPDSLVGRTMQTIAEASLAMQPLNGITSLAMHTSQANTPASDKAGSVEEECIPEEPQPIDVEPKQEEVEIVEEVEVEAAPIVIDEEEPMPREQAAPVASGPSKFTDWQVGLTLRQAQEVAPKGCPIVMPYCPDDEVEPTTTPAMPSAEQSKTDDSSEEAEETEFTEWLKLIDADKKDKSPTAEELPAPTEEEQPQAESKCQEDSHLHEHYSGCPRVTCPYTGKSYPSCTPANRSGKEEASEEPPHESKKHHHRKVGKGNGEELPVPNVDTMEYRKSDAGLNEYGPGPLH